MKTEEVEKDRMVTPNISAESGRPIAVLGAGDLVSHLHRGDDESDPANYRFNILRFCRDLETSHTLRPCDLRDIVKLCQVLAFTIADDGWISADTREVLIDLADDLDELTQRWSDPSNG